MAINSGYTLTAYFNTGFNGVDIPADASVLETATKVVYNDNYFLREDVDKPTISVNDTYANLRDCDYVKLTPKSGNTGGVTCYYFCVPSAAAHKTTILALELDALLTMGGAKNLNYISGWQERGHVTTADDDAFSNTAPENFAPRKPLIVRGADFDLTPARGNKSDLFTVVSTVNLATVANGDEVGVITGVDSLSDEKMYFPKIEVVDYETPFTSVTDINNGTPVTTNGYLKNTCAFDFTKAHVKKGLQALYSAGQLSLMASYKIPAEFLASNPNIDSAGVIGQITGVNTDIALSSDTKFKYSYDVTGYTVKNKKTYTLFNQYQIVNIASGASVIKDAYDLYKSGDTAPTVFVWADPSPNGKPMARFKYERDAANLYADVVIGAPWYQQQLVFEGASGSLWNTIQASFSNANLNRQLQENKLLQQYTQAQYGRDIARLDYNSRFAITGTAINMGFDVAKGAVGAVGDFAAGNYGQAARGAVDIAQTSINGARDIANIASQYAMNKADRDAQNAYTQATQGLTERAIAQAINENSVGLLKNNTVVSPTVMFTPSDTMALYGVNRFKGYHITLDDDDVKELDKYFQRYGYNGLHRPLTAACFNARTYYSYVQAFDVNIKSTFGMRIRQKAISQLNAGVRVWKVLPDASYYDTN